MRAARQRSRRTSSPCAGWRCRGGRRRPLASMPIADGAEPIAGVQDMDLGFKRYQETLRRTARGYLEKACSLENLRAADASEAGFSLEHYREMAALGWFAVALPTAAG